MSSLDNRESNIVRTMLARRESRSIKTSSFLIYVPWKSAYCMASYGYRPVAITPGLWQHETRDIVFSLVADDFGVRYTLQAGADHLIFTLQTCGYQVSCTMLTLERFAKVFERKI